MKCVVLAVCVAFALAQNPPKPTLPNDFEAKVFIVSAQGDRQIKGDGFWVENPSKNMGVANYEFHDGPFPLFSYDLQRYDLSTQYILESRDRNECRSRPLTGKMPTAWSFLSNATYGGKDIFKGVSIDLWDASSGGNQVRLGVLEKSASTPVFIENRGRGYFTNIEFQEFKANANPDSKYFDIPKECKSSQVAVKDDPVKPAPTNNFEARVVVQVTRHDGPRISGDGAWVECAAKNMGIEDYKFHDGPFPMWSYDNRRYDLGSQYIIESRDKNECMVRPLPTGGLPSVWTFLSNATFGGQDIFKGFAVDLWDNKINNIEMRLAVDSKNVNIPIFYETRGTGFYSNLEFQKFTENSNPDPKYFEIPTECKGLAAPVKDDPVRPAPSDNFEAQVTIQVAQKENPRISGDGFWVECAAENRGIENYKFHDGPFPMWSYDNRRYDLGSQYIIESRDKRECMVRPLPTGKLPSVWTFLSNATYSGQDIFKGFAVDLWDNTINNVEIRLAVSSKSVNTPIFMETKGTGYFSNVEFQKFAVNQTPDPKYFEIPSECKGL